MIQVFFPLAAVWFLGACSLVFAAGWVGEGALEFFSYLFWFLYLAVAWCLYFFLVLSPFLSIPYALMGLINNISRSKKKDIVLKIMLMLFFGPGLHAFI
jgi:hypothetical protein